MPTLLCRIEIRFEIGIYDLVFDDKHHGIGIVPSYIVLLETGFVFF